MSFFRADYYREVKVNISGGGCRVVVVGCGNCRGGAMYIPVHGTSHLLKRYDSINSAIFTLWGPPRVQ